MRSFAKEEATLGRYDDAQRAALRFGLRSALLEGFFLSANSAVATGAVMVVLWYGARQVIGGALTAGRLSSFIVYAVFVASNAGMLMGVFSSVTQVGGGCSGDVDGGLAAK